MSEQNDQEIVDRVLNGDTDAFNILILKYQRMVANLIYRMIKNQNDVPDLVQETFFKAFKGLASFKKMSLFSTWLHKIASRVALDYIDKSKRRTPSHDIELDDDRDESKNFDYYLEDEGFNPEQSLVSKENFEKAVKVINSLPANLRDPLILREQCENSYEEIAVILGVSVKSVKSSIFRARDIVRNELIKLKIL